MYRFRDLIALSALVAIAHPAIADDEANRIAFNNYCRTCHSISKDDNRLGPTLRGIFGAEADRVTGFRGYSGGLAGLTWDEATLDRFIADPAALASSTNMIYPPVDDAAERAKIIAYLKSCGQP